jgi:hypothetical protein
MFSPTHLLTLSENAPSLVFLTISRTCAHSTLGLHIHNPNTMQTCGIKPAGICLPSEGPFPLSVPRLHGIHLLEQGC